MSIRRFATISGVSLILMALIAGFSFGYAFPEFFQPNEIDSLKENILNNLRLYREMLIGIIAILLLDFLVSYTLFGYFKEDNRKLSIASGAFRVVYSLIFGVATFYLAKNLNADEISNQAINTNFQSFQFLWSIGLVIFGCHLILMGVLMKLHNRIPKILWYLTLIAGASYLLVHILKLISPNAEFVHILEMTLALPMAIGELGLAIWLLVSGGNVTQNRNSNKHKINS